MRQTPVGVRCPECARQRTRSQLPAFMMGNEPRVTYGLIAANVLLFIATNNINGGGGGGGLFGTGGQLNSLGLHLALWGPAVHDGQYYRLVSSAFIHYGLLHLAFNMYALYLAGTIVERWYGSIRFGAIYLACAAAGSTASFVFGGDAPSVGRRALQVRRRTGWRGGRGRAAHREG